jgi:hypothetical protein
VQIKLNVLLLAVLSLSLLISTNAFAKAEEKPEPEKPFRPIPDLPMVLLFEGFEQSAGMASKGGTSEDVASPPGRKSYKMGIYTKNLVFAAINFGRSKIPGGVNPNEVYIQYMIWSDDLGTITTKFLLSGGTDFADKTQINKPKTWQTVTLRLSDAHAKGGAIKPDSALSQMEIYVTPRGIEAPKVYIDDVTITVGTKPADIMGRILAMQGKTADTSRTNTKDGFHYSPQTDELLKAALKRSAKRHKPNHVLVMGAVPGDGENVRKIFLGAGAKAKINGFSFLSPVSPDKSQVGGLDDLRTLLSYNLAKTDPEYVLIIVSSADAAKVSRNTDSFRGCLERALDMGVIPVVCLPQSASGDKSKIDSFSGGLIRLCNELGICWVDTNTAIKDAKEATEKEELSTAGIEAMGVIALQALKHVDINARK